MIDLHCHILPGIDDGAPDLATSMRMARIAVEDGITHIACTPHIYPGLYENDSAGIKSAVVQLQQAFDAEGIALKLFSGADTHLAPDLISSLRAGVIPTINDSRYLLLEPPHHVAPPRFEESVFQLVSAGYVPVITHPERLTWIETHYPIFESLVRSGALMQITAGSVTGRFGKRPRYWAERMLDEGLVHVVATDAHRADSRPPLLNEAREAIASRLGALEATHQVVTRPQGIVDDVPLSSLPPLPQSSTPPGRASSSWWQRLTGSA